MNTRFIKIDDEEIWKKWEEKKFEEETKRKERFSRKELFLKVLLEKQ